MMAPSMASHAVRALALAGGLMLVTGCGCGKENDRTVVYTDGLVVGTEYQSSPVEGPWLHFPGGRRYQLFHRLGVEPTRYEAYLGFEEHDPSEFTIGTGNSARFREVNDEYLVVENDTCAGFYLRVVASCGVVRRVSETRRPGAQTPKNLLTHGPQGRKVSQWRTGDGLATAAFGPIYPPHGGPMLVLIAKETQPGETRVAATAETVKQLVKRGAEVLVEPGAGEQSFIDDDEYQAAGAKLGDGYDAADVVLCVRPPDAARTSRLKPGATVIGFLDPFKNDDFVRKMVEQQVTTLSMELVPRITRAQKMDALSSQASIGGYKAVLIAANYLPKYFPLLMTAAGTVKPAHVVVMGAGVAGLQAIATAKRLGAVVEASDIRPEVKEQIESLGGKFIPLPKREESGSGQGGYAKEMSKEYLAEQRAIVKAHVARAHVVVTTALVPGRPAPRLVPTDMVQAMAPGGVIVDLAIEQGGNCELTELGKEVVKHGIRIVGHPNLPATLPADASMLYARNVYALLDNCLDKTPALQIDLTDDVTGPTLLTHRGEVFHVPTAERLDLPRGQLPAPEKPEGKQR
jgi:NAD(P) transhydrogenase subunit alpha